MLVTIVETSKFLKQARELLSEDELDELKYHLAVNPRWGEVIRGTGGIRKARWGAKGKGKRGGARIIHYFHTSGKMVFLLAAYGKSVKIDLTETERKELKTLVEAIQESKS